MTDIDDSTAFARGNETSVHGKLTAEIPTIRVADTTRALLDLAAAKAGVNLSEYIRLWLEIHVHGRDHLLSLYQDKLERVSGNASQMPRDGGAS